MNYKKYMRRFIILMDETEEFPGKEGPIQGHLRIETGNNKGAIRCMVEHAKGTCFEKNKFKLIFLGKKEDQVISAIIGTLAINGNGRGENYFRFTPCDMDGKGNEFADFSTVAIVGEKNTEEHESPELKIILKGELYEDPNVHEVHETLKSESKDADANASKADKVSEEVNLSKSQNNKKEKKIYNDFYNKFLINACLHICQTAENLQDIEPFDEDKTQASWKKIKTISQLPVIAPGAHYFAARYKHYIFGAKDSEEKKTLNFYIGIPGKNIKEEQPDGGESGFVYWQPIKGKDEVYGYWIIKINGFTGNISSI